MPSEKEIEEALDYAHYMEPKSTWRILADAYLSMKSERDRYKKIVEKDTIALRAFDSWWRLANVARTVENIEPAMCFALEALSLRDQREE
jgi:hypothetical protein